MTDSAQVKATIITQALSEPPTALVYGVDNALGEAVVKELLMTECAVFGIAENENDKPDIVIDDNRYRKISTLDLDIQNFRIDYIFYIPNPLLEQKDTEPPAILDRLLSLAISNKAKFQLVDLFDSSLSSGSIKFHQTITEYCQIEKPSSLLESKIINWCTSGHLKINFHTVKPLYLYGPGVEKISQNSLEQILINAVYLNQIPQTDNFSDQEISPLYLTDAAGMIVKNIFIPSTKNKMVYLFSEEKIAIQQVIKDIQKIIPDIQTKTDSEKSFNLPILNTRPYFPFTAKTAFSTGLIHTLDHLNTHRQNFTVGFMTNVQTTKVKENINIPKQEIKIPPFRLPVLPTIKFKIKKKLLVVAALFLALLVLLGSLPGIILVIQMNKIKGEINRLTGLVKTKNLEVLGADLNHLSGSLNTTRQLFSLYETPLSIMQMQKKYHETQKLLTISATALDGLKNLLAGAKNYSLVLQSIFSTETASGLGLKMAFAKEGLMQADEKLAIVKTELTTLDFNATFLSGKTNAIIGYLSAFDKYRVWLSRLRDFSVVLPELIGLNGRRIYLVIFNNNMELRPGGGFIGSYALITLDHGKMSELKIDDVYNADGQLTGHVEPPAPIKKYLEQPHWYLRDSNWSPDFYESAERAEWFLDKEISRKVDGTVMIDLNVIKALLLATGAVNLPDYQETITAENLFAKATYYSQDNFFPGSTQKKDFLSSLAQRLLDKVMTQSSQITLPFLTSLSSLLEQKHLVLYFHDEATQNLVTRFNWGGRTAKNICGQERQCLSDYLMPVEANLGVNKANAYIKRSIAQKILLSSDSSSSSELEINYINQSIKESKTEGTYKNYLRLYLPKNSVVNKIFDNGQEINFSVKNETELGKPAKEQKPQSNSATEITKTDELEKTSYGFMVEIPPQSSKTITVYYIQPIQLTAGVTNSYSLLVQKQMGTNNDDYKLDIYIPKGFTAVNQSNELKINNQTAGFTGQLDQDRIFSLQLKP